MIKESSRVAIKKEMPFSKVNDEIVRDELKQGKVLRNGRNWFGNMEYAR